MNAKLKGLFKGLRYISSIFEEEKEEEIVIGLPTDVKHVAHIGWEGQGQGQGHGPAPTNAESSPSWMKKIPASEGVSQPTNFGGIKQNSENLERKSSKPKSSTGDSGEMSKATRRRPKELSETTQNTNSPVKERPRNSRRRSSKETSENGISSNKHLQLEDATLASGASPARNLPEAQKKYRRRKSKENQTQLEGVESVLSGSGHSSRSKGKRDHGHGRDHGHSHSRDHGHGHGRHGHHHDDHELPVHSVKSNDSSLRSQSKEDKEYRQVL